MLTPSEIEEIKHEVERAGRGLNASVEALKIVQRQRRWVPDEELEEVSKLLGVTTHELDAVATFYSFIFRRPVGKNLILVCDGPACWMLNGHMLAETIKAELGIGLGETTKDGEFTFLPISCIGLCDKAPAMMINDDVYGGLTPEKVREALKKYR
ncbi:MAG: NADH-quinone oxidoreductase subunit NuoE [Actinomycetota bacterium]|nr:NADH-quinone oxidoreductase subunit NuoE [Actinomycetota bacterium]